MSESNGKIAGAASIVGGATFLSRIFGYLRDVVIAYFFGAGLFADAFFAAFRVSNLFRRMVGEGVVSAAFVPIYTGVLKDRSEADARRFVSNAFTVFLLLFIALAVVGIVFSETLVSLIAPGFAENPEKLSITVSITRGLFPYTIFIGLVGVAMGVLNTLRRFAVPALSPVLFNVSIIVSALVLVPILDIPVYALVVGVLLGGALQLAFQMPTMIGLNVFPRPHIDLNDRELGKVFKLLGPTVVGSGIYQLNIFVTLWFASTLPEGSISYLFYATRLMEFPLGVFGVAIATAVLPQLSSYVAHCEWDSFKEALSFGMRLLNFLTIPATVGLLLLAAPIIETLFMRGEFGKEAASGTAFALYFYALGIVPVAAFKLTANVFYSLKDTKSPVYAAIAGFVVNIVMCILLMGPLGHGGLAFATSIAGTVQFLLLVAILRARFGPIGARGMLSSGIKSAIATLVMGGAIVAALLLIPVEGAGAAIKAFFVLGVVAMGTGVYFMIARALRAPEYASIMGIILRKGRKDVG